MKRLTTVATIAVAQLALVGVAVAPQLSARLTGETHLVRVAPLDPIDPYRGAYVELDYPDLRASDAPGASLGAVDDGDSGTVYITLRHEGEVVVADEWRRERPEGQPYLTCDDRSWAVRCGIESWFLPQDEAAAMEQQLVDGAIAEIRVDRWGHAAIVDVRSGSR